MKLADTLEVPHHVWLAFAQAYTPENHELKNWEIRGKAGEGTPARFAVSVEDTRGDAFALEVPIPEDPAAAILAVRAYREINGLDCPWVDGDDPLVEVKAPRVTTPDAITASVVLASDEDEPRVLHFGYVDGKGNETERAVQVTSITRRYDGAVFFGYDLEKEAARQFRFDRVQWAQVGEKISS